MLAQGVSPGNCRVSAGQSPGRAALGEAHGTHTIVSPFQGLQRNGRTNVLPRLTPGAGMFRPFRAETQGTHQSGNMVTAWESHGTHLTSAERYPSTRTRYALTGSAPVLTTYNRRLFRLPRQMHHQRLLRVHAVFRLLEYRRVRQARGGVVDLIAVVGGQAVQDDGVFLCPLHHAGVDRVGGEDSFALGRFVLWPIEAHTSV